MKVYMYVPAKIGFPNAEQIAKGLMLDFWGEKYLNEKSMEELTKDLYVRVFDDGKGIPFADVLAAISKQITDY